MPTEDKRHKFIWGWLRLFLGFAQMSLVALSLGSLVTDGPHPLTLAFCIGATVLTCTSRLLYKGRSASQQNRGSGKVKS